MEQPEYKISSTRTKSSFWSTVVLAILGLPTLGIGLGLQEAWGLICLTPTGVVMIALAAYSYFFESRRNEGFSIQIDESGLTYTDQDGLQTHFLWQEVESLTWVESRSRSGSQTVTTRLWRLKRKDGETLTFDKRWDNMGALIGQIQRYLTDKMLPELRGRLLRGERLQFGQYGISHEGLHNGDMLLRWSEIDQLRLEEHRGAQRLMVEQNGAWRWWASTTNFPNYFLFLRLLPVVGRSIEEEAAQPAVSG